MSDKTSQVHTLFMDELYIEALIDALLFSARTAAFLAHKEIAAGRTGGDTAKLTQISKDSEDILKYIQESIRIGEPFSDEKH